VADGGEPFNGRLLRPDTCEATEQEEATPGGSRGGKGLTQGEQPLGGRGSDTEPKYRVDPNNGCRRATNVTIVHRTTSDPREEPGALAAHAGICAGGGEKSSSLVRCGLLSEEANFAEQRGER
jgi:hypothetical protein